MSPSWSVAVTHSGRVRTAEENLARQGFEFYNPKIVKTTYERGRRLERRIQLFPGYIFVLVVDRWRSLLSTFGIATLVMSAGHPARISHSVVEKIRAREVEGLVVLPQARFKEGQQVQVVSGPLAMEYGLYEGQRDRDRVSVLMNLLGRSTSVVLREGNLVAA